MNNTALIVVDYQKCFVEGGSLGVAGGLALAPYINRIMEEVKSRAGLVIATRDWHPETSVHFDRWPVHAVAGTESAEYVDSLRKELIDTEIFKGFRNSDDGYSGFEGVTALSGSAQGGFEVAPDAKTLLQVLREHRIQAVKVLGLATDFCVRDTLLGARENGFETEFLRQGAASVYPENEESVLLALAETGVTFA